ncbi:uncharacterized protein SCDLUD_000560 [Saccharomycodes ludwigii]|uniref:uncharacterized protein n=1 Tax=Saccharomycodes ludwigii TaxID=36035 RepID=UPI001E8698A4|nr:hypothetical protein SCDLUD_000560 [Saccharomycodes ludwigii]KAH3902960.1 hypothetical protein SCDLUD_000560 [Saccharomycodes ludwigii]
MAASPIFYSRPNTAISFSSFYKGFKVFKWSISKLAQRLNASTGSRRLIPTNTLLHILLISLAFNALDSYILNTASPFFKLFLPYLIFLYTKNDALKYGSLNSTNKNDADVGRNILWRTLQTYDLENKTRFSVLIKLLSKIRYEEKGLTNITGNRNDQAKIHMLLLDYNKILTLIILQVFDKYSTRNSSVISNTSNYNTLIKSICFIIYIYITTPILGISTSITTSLLPTLLLPYNLQIILISHILNLLNSMYLLFDFYFETLNQLVLTSSITIRKQQQEIWFRSRLGILLGCYIAFYLVVVTILPGWLWCLIWITVGEYCTGLLLTRVTNELSISNISVNNSDTAGASANNKCANSTLTLIRISTDKNITRWLNKEIFWIDNK